MLALLLLLTEAPDDPPMTKPEISEHQLREVGLDGCTFGAPPEEVEALRIALAEAMDAPRCQRKAARRGEDAEGELVVRLHIRPDGTAHQLQFESADMAAPTLEACLERRIVERRYPANPKAGETPVRYRTTWTGR